MFTKTQPKDGDVIVHCGHIDAPKMHFTLVPGKMGFRRPDGTIGETEWICECDKCFSARGNTRNFQIRGDGTWIGDEPSIKVNPMVN